MARIRLAGVWASAVLVISSAGYAADFKSVGDNAAILYDAPSARAKKIFVIGRGYPLQVLVTVQGFVKVRDSSGALAWIEAQSLSDHHTVMVKVAMAEVRRTAADDAPLVFQAARGVLLDLNQIDADGWARVTHADGQSGYIKLSQIWGA